MLSVIALTWPLSACLVTSTEVVRQTDAVKLFGNQFVMSDDQSGEEVPFRWSELRRAYVDASSETLMRFGHLQREVYLAEYQPLPNPRGGGGAADSVRMLLLVRISGTRVWIQMAQCLGMQDTNETLALRYGTELDRSGGHLTGGRAGILGLYLASLECHQEPLGMRITPETITPGGAELAAAAAAPSLSNLVPYLNRVCGTGDTQACYRLGQLYGRGEGVARDASRAAALFDRVCTAGYTGGCLDLALLVDAGEGVARDTARATALLKQACDGHDAYACELMKTRR
jgi:hypothetical protein